MSDSYIIIYFAFSYLPGYELPSFFAAVYDASAYNTIYYFINKYYSEYW